MKLYCIAVLHKGETKVNSLASAHELSPFGYFQRSSVKEFMDFTCQIVAERTMVGSRASMKEKEYICHVYVRSDCLTGLVIADHEYPQRVAHTLINKVLEEFTGKVPKSQWPTANQSRIVYGELAGYLQKYQDPKQADSMTKIQSELDETKIILYDTIEKILERGEKLEDMVDNSDRLSMHAKAFFQVARKTNSCCVIL
ncbi:synaptobrevin homolog YKT6-like isoform X1 [Crassostrea angulata]|uniref:synaptobrevin homolog YKT6-like isoform X1 n=1 Tax=Magallana angulata TaxID=2784310 RepID=UPI0022B166A5|nr:synaptobrevin homolog YKT6-like isoform X1 [Crassostrea angulata]